MAWTYLDVACADLESKKGACVFVVREFGELREGG